MKMGICGASGTGKSSLAESLSKSLGLPFFRSKDITQIILTRDGYDYSSGIQIEQFLANSGRQNEILRRTIEQQSTGQFVTDRTVVDLAAYAVCEMHDEVEAVKHIYETCRKYSTIYTHLLLCPWREKAITDNQKRTLNPWYQLMIHAVERGILDDWGCSYYVVETNETNARVLEVSKLLGIS
jgi:predicted ATPase